MSDEYVNEENEENEEEELEIGDEIDSDEEFESDEEMEASGEEEIEYEEISSDEVDRVVASLEELIESTTSDNIRTQLEEAMNAVFYLVYDESDLEDEDEDVSAEAA